MLSSNIKSIAKIPMDFINCEPAKTYDAYLGMGEEKSLLKKSKKKKIVPGKRIRATKACDQCSLKRSKCSGNFDGCSKCAELGLSCTFTRAVKKRGPPKKSALETKSNIAKIELFPTSPLHNISLDSSCFSDCSSSSTTACSISPASPTSDAGFHGLLSSNAIVGTSPLDSVSYFPVDTILASDMFSLGMLSPNDFIVNAVTNSISSSVKDPLMPQATANLPFPIFQTTSESIAHLYSVSMMHQATDASSLMSFPWTGEQF